MARVVADRASVAAPDSAVEAVDSVAPEVQGGREAGNPAVRLRTREAVARHNRRLEECRSFLKRLRFVSPRQETRSRPRGTYTSASAS